MYQGRQAVREGFEFYLAGLVRDIEFGNRKERRKAKKELKSLGENPLYQTSIQYVADLLRVQPDGFETAVLLELQKISSIHVGDLERAAVIQAKANQLQPTFITNLFSHYSGLERASIDERWVVADYHRPGARIKNSKLLLDLLRKPGSPN